jgi:predicted nucleotidyltransferase
MILFSKIEHDVRSIFPKVGEYFCTRSEIEIGYVFGSYGEHREQPLSDVDLALLFRKEVPPETHFALRLEILKDLFAILKTREVDLVILNEADICLAYNVISTSEVLYERDALSRIEFEVNVTGRYMDFRYIRNMQEEIFLRQIREGLVFG